MPDCISIETMYSDKDYSRLPVAKGCFIAGFSPALFAAPLWYACVAQVWPDPVGYFYVTVIALVGGLLLNLTIGLFVLSLMTAYEMNSVYKAGAIGAFIPFAWMWITSDPWSIVLFMSALGGISGVVASYYSLRYLHKNREIEARILAEKSIAADFVDFT